MIKYIERSRKCIDIIVRNRLTKYNLQPLPVPALGRQNTSKVLVIDQTYGDMSVEKGMGSERVFHNMLNAAIEENPNSDIIVKTHPDIIVGTKTGYYSNYKAHNNVYVQANPVNPISLIQTADKIYVCSSQFGFEALMCSKEVVVFGMPFYAGWGVTNDRQLCERRVQRRSLEEIFYVAYILYSHYVNPETGEKCEIEEAMDYLIKLRNEYFTEKGFH